MSYTYEFSHYEEVPTFVTQKIVTERQAELAEKAAEKENRKLLAPSIPFLSKSKWRRDFY
jgi:hypothetical protein